MRVGLLALAVTALVATSLAAASAQGKQPWLGVVIADGHPGALIHEVIAGTPADAAGLEAGDIVVGVGDQTVGSASQLISQVTKLRVGETTRLAVIRHHERIALETTLAAKLTESQILARRLVDKLLPRFSLRVSSGSHSGNVDDHRGDVVLVYFFSPHCRRCPALTERIDALRAAHARDGMVVLGVVSGAPSRRAGPAARRAGFTVLADDDDWVRLNSFRANALPVVVLAGRDGFVRYAAAADGIDFRQLRFAVTRALREPKTL